MPPTPIDYNAAGFWFGVAQWIGLILLGVWTYLRTKDNDNTTAVAKVAKDLSGFIAASTDANADQNTRLTRLEETIKHLPTDDEVAQIAADLASVKSHVQGQSEALTRIERHQALMYEHLLSKGK